MNQVEVYTIEPAFSDERGEIFDLIESKVGHTGLITSAKNAVRANHYHLISTQYTYIVSGTMELKTKHKDDRSTPDIVILKPGMMAIIPPLFIHTLTALEDSVFLDSTTLSRSDGGYEADTIRVTPL